LRSATPESFVLHDAQFVLARSYGFESWAKLKAVISRSRLRTAITGADVNTQGAHGDVALIHLIEHGASLEIKNARGQIALDAARARRRDRSEAAKFSSGLNAH
jgi:hypothetical protein